MSIEDKHIEVLDRFDACKYILTSKDRQAIDTLLAEFDLEYPEGDTDTLESILDQINEIMDDGNCT